MSQPLTIEPGQAVRLCDFNPAYHGDLRKDAAAPITAEHLEALDDLSYRLYAEHRRSVLLVLQGMDAAGKDGTIRHVVQGLDPLTTHVHAFRQPNDEELDHDFLWRVHRQTPRRGMVGIFNRSHYEDVVIVRVQNLVNRSEWTSRFEQINAFEKMLVEEGTTIIKVFLHISRGEQKKRLEARLQDPRKYWKLSQSDITERKLWDEYIAAYEDALTHCNTAHAPWHIVPADRKWYRNLVVSRLMHDALRNMDPQFPPAESWVTANMRID